MRLDDYTERVTVGGATSDALIRISPLTIFAVVMLIEAVDGLLTLVDGDGETILQRLFAGISAPWYGICGLLLLAFDLVLTSTFSRLLYTP